MSVLFANLPGVRPADEDELLRSVCRESFKCFAREFWDQIPGTGKLVWNWHLDVFCEEIQLLCERVFRGDRSTYDLVVNVSPGTSKSSFFSVLAQAWTWTRMSECRHLCFSHTDSLVLDLADRCRYVILSDKYRTLFPEVQLRADRSSREDYMNTHGGERKSCTVGGKTPTGRHSHLIWGDDPLDPQEALSEAKLKTARHFVNEVIPSRKVDKSVTPMALVMQRLGLGDSTEVMLEHGRKEGARAVRHVCLPAEVRDDKTREIVSPPELLERYDPSGLLDPVRLPKDVLRDFEARGALYYATQFLQQPFSPEGGLFKDRYFNQRAKAAPFKCKRVRYWDRASSEDISSCQTSGTLMGRSVERNYYIEDVVTGHWEPYERNQIMLATALRDRAKYGPNDEPTIWVEQEGGASDKGDFKEIARTLAGFKVRCHRVSNLGSKQRRAEPWSCQLAAGNVYVVDNGEREGTGRATWDVNGYIHEHVAFPGGRLKDRVDSSSGAFNVLSDVKQAGTLRTVPLRAPGGKKFTRRVVVCSIEELSELQVEHQSLLCVIRDPEFAPKEVVPSSDSSDSIRVGEGEGASCLPPPPVPSTGLQLLQESVALCFADLEPADLQEAWHVPLAGYGVLPEKVVMGREQAKSLWRMLTKARPVAWEVLVIADSGEGDRRALSAAYAVCDTLGVPRGGIYCLADPERKHDDARAPSEHVYAQTRQGRGLVV